MSPTAVRPSVHSIRSQTTATPPASAPQPKASGNGAGSGHLARAVSLHLAGKHQEALQQLTQAVATNQGSPEVYRAMAHIYFELENFKEAARAYSTLVQLKPQYGMGWFNLAVCHERMGSWDEASEAFHKAASLDPRNLEAHLGLGVCHLRLEDPKSALFSFDRCLELSPAHEDAAFGKASALQSLGHSDQAAAIYQNILDLRPGSHQAAAARDQRPAYAPRPHSRRRGPR